MKLHPTRGRNQQGLCFVSPETIDSTIKTCELVSQSKSVYSDIRISDKVPEGIIILDARIYDMLDCRDDDEIRILPLPDKIPLCTEIHLDVFSKRDLENRTVVHAISERIDDFQEHFEGLVLQQGQEFSIYELGVSFIVRSLSPTDPSTSAARIAWKNLLKIHLGVVEAKPTNLCLIVEVAAATQIADVSCEADVGEPSCITRHQAILNCLKVIEKKLLVYASDVQFAGVVFSDEIIPFITFDPQTGEENEITKLHSSSIIGAFRQYVDTTLDEFSNRPSNPGVALKNGIEKAQSLTDVNGLQTTIVFFSSGIYSAGQNPVKIARINLENRDVRVLCVAVGEDSAADIMEAIAKEGKGTSIHLNSIDRINLIVDAINRMTTNHR